MGGKGNQMIINKGQVVSRKEKYCNNVFSQGLGLMFSKRKNLVMVFNKERKISLHNCFVFFPIDVLVLDSDKKIIEIKKNFSPFTFWNSVGKGKYVVELAFPGEYCVGDVLVIEKLKNHL
tara:strand:- start:242 stop:601 length:360 start_codon:yes stop_codon:yes gene_type:complete